MRKFYAALTAILVTVCASHALEVPALVATKCSGCHQVPRPGSMPRDVWPKINRKMVDFMTAANLPITEAEINEITSYYLANSDRQLMQIPNVFGETGLSFEQARIGRASLDERPQVT